MENKRAFFNHFNINVSDIGKSADFYRRALGLEKVGGIDSSDGSFKIAYLGDGETAFRLELTWLRDKEGKYDLGDNEFHLAFETDDYEAAHARHKAMGCICYENPEMGIYFISDPDGYWLEITPGQR